MSVDCEFDVAGECNKHQSFHCSGTVEPETRTAPPRRGSTVEALADTFWSAWISPSGVIHAVAYGDHTNYAELVLKDDTGGARLEDNWLHISEARIDFPRRNITQAQRNVIFDLLMFVETQFGFHARYLKEQCQRIMDARD